MIAEISAGFSSLKAAKDMVQAMNGMQTAASINDVKLTLQGHILEAQQSLFAAQEAQSSSARRISDLEQEIVALKDWSAEKQRYQLHDIGRGAMAYVPKLGMLDGEPPHWLCVRCFGQCQKSFMQFKGNGAGNQTTAQRGLDNQYACDICKASFRVSYNTSPNADARKRREQAAADEENADHMRDSTP
ncbi:hypothetical protein ABIC16_002246 [Sphingomonas sp. PvP055]|uniref:hypothetical protein n=1 Tax=Sphingomonas sp. PvP055 TaxID=3156391 RepID=UPI00339966CE